MGIGDPETNKGDAFETGKKIVPECVYPSEGEVHLRQYEVATLQNRFIVFPVHKAKGKMQVTNRRVIFRAPGRTLTGRNCIHQKFAVNEVAGIEARRHNVVFIIKTKMADEPICIKRTGLLRFAKSANDTGYLECLPTEETEKCIREINAIIGDMQKYGDQAINKWQA